ncbi:MAG: alpha-E domain-containing protein [Burkholderiaceae bacterium]|nr:alpha-E domain-containing protein [Burkholderiaceae bacterium]
MLSRVAENLYWMARYLERAENTARLINSMTQVLLDLPKSAYFGWDLLLQIVGLDCANRERYPQADEDSIMHLLVSDTHNRSSILSCVHLARENARTVREVLPMEIWERINQLFLYVRESAPQAVKSRGPRYEMLNGVIERRESIIGLLSGSMSRDDAHHFMQLGRFVERADMTTRIVDIHFAVHMPDDSALATLTRERSWIGTLTALSAYQAYRRQVGVHVEAAAVTNFILKDRNFPRSVSYCLSELDQALASLPHNDEPLCALQDGRNRLVGTDIAALDWQTMHHFLDKMQADLGKLHSAIAAQYFHLHHTKAAADAAVHND